MGESQKFSGKLRNKAILICHHWFMLKEVFNKEDCDSKKCPRAVVEFDTTVNIVNSLGMDTLALEVI